MDSSCLTGRPDPHSSAFSADEWEYRRWNFSILVLVLKDQLCSKLKRARIKGGRHRAEIAGAEVSADSTIVVVAFKLRVVPGIEGVGAKLEAAAALFIDSKGLE